MKQPGAMSLAESIANVAMGCGLAAVTRLLCFPPFKQHMTLAENLTSGAIFTLVSTARSYVRRQLFKRLRRA